MKVFSRLAVVCMVCLMAVTLGGCSFWFNSGDPGPGDNNWPTTTPNRVPLPVDHERVPNEEIDTLVAMMQLQSEAVQGVRATYLPGVDEVSSDAVLQADRQKYFQNAAYQYEIVATYILHVLQGKYGDTKAQSTITYDFYANTSLSGTFYEGKEIRNSTDRTSLDIILPANTPEDGDAKLFETDKNAINNPVVNVELEYTVATPNGNTACPPARAVYDPSLAWNANGSDITSFVPVVQLNLMQNALGLPLSPLSTTATSAQSQIVSLSKQITKLGIEQSADYYDFLLDYMSNVIIGADLMARDEASLNYTDPSYTYYLWEQVGTRLVGDPPVEEPVYDWVAHTGYYQMLGSGTPHTFSSDTIYKFGYKATLNDIATAILGTFGSNGEQTSTGFSTLFPTYTRVEITDSQPFNHYYSNNPTLEDDEPQKMDSMDYREYNSVIIYPDAEAYTEEEFGVAIDPEKKNWLFDYFNIYIDSVMDITIDIYLRVHFEGETNPSGDVVGREDVLVHLTRMNTDSKKDYHYSPEIEDYSEKYYDQNGIIKKEYAFDETKTNARMISLYTVAGAETFTKLHKPIPNPYTVDEPTESSFRQFYHEALELDEDGHPKVLEEGTVTYHNLFAGKLGSNLDIDTPKHRQNNLSIKNYYDKTVDLGAKYLCQEKCDFVEFIFDVQKYPALGNDYDYSFKFSILPLFFNDDSADLDNE